MKEYNPKTILNSINPKKDPKYSPNLYKWMKANKSMTRNEVSIWEDGDASYIGYLDEGRLIGSDLWHILGQGKRATTGYYINIKNPKKKMPFTEYIEKGRCAFDLDHEITFLDERYSLSGEGRTCKWCGLTQKREFHEVVEKEIRWINVK